MSGNLGACDGASESCAFQWRGHCALAFSLRGIWHEFRVDLCGHPAQVWPRSENRAARRHYGMASWLGSLWSGPNALGGLPRHAVVVSCFGGLVSAVLGTMAGAAIYTEISPN
jgi:hypothetical protein